MTSNSHPKQLGRIHTSVFSIVSCSSGSIRPRLRTLSTVVLFQFLMCAACAIAADTNLPEPIRIVLQNTEPLKFPRGDRLPIFLWPAMNPGRLSDDQALKLVQDLDRRGVS